MDQADDPQASVFQFLGDPATHGGRDVQRIDTHANVVFLAGDRAFKLKRAVRFPFLDYSTLAKRKAACASELEVNRAFAPELYRRILPITRNSSGQLALNGDGEAIEWAVEMLRFDDKQTLDRIADASGIDDALAQKLAAMVAAMHERVPVIDASLWIAALKDFIDQNTAAFREYPALFQTDLAAKLDQVAHSELERLRSLLASRGARGLIRRGHGDLHLGNIALLDGRPVPFDAIEFDPIIASGDVLYDLAFLLMDLIERGFDRAANIVFNGYFSRLQNIEDLDGLAALPFFMSLRAAIRAKVTAARLRYVESKDQARPRRSGKSLLPTCVDVACTSRRPCWWRSAVCQEPASHRWRANWPRLSRLLRELWWFGPTSSARGSLASRKPSTFHPMLTAPRSPARFTGSWPTRPPV